jgi:hypothetical protein
MYDAPIRDAAQFLDDIQEMSESEIKDYVANLKNPKVEKKKNRSPVCKPLKSNGCGAENGVKISNIPIGCNYTQACNAHDLCYGSSLSQERCDRRFLRDMLAVAAKKRANWFEDSSRFDFEKEITKMFYYPQRLLQDIHAESCRNVAVSYYSAVSTMGNSAYTAAQENRRICSGQ